MEEAFDREAHNCVQRRIRIVVEWGFGELKNRWRLLSAGSYMYKDGMHPLVIKIAIALNNRIFRERSCLRTLSDLRKTNEWCLNKLCQLRLARFGEICAEGGTVHLSREEVANALRDE